MRYALVFDFGGVIMKTVTHAPRWAWDEKLGLERGSIERAVHNAESWRRAQTGELSLEDYWADVARQLRHSADEMPQLEADFYSGDQLDEDIIALIRSRKASGQKVALLSNDSPALIAKLDQLGITELFEPIVVSARIGVMKPDPAAYHAVLEQLAHPAEDTVFIDDMPANIDGARAVGMIGIRYTPGLDLAQELAPFFE
jgi:epoxide hydrolase-like predicted phosphatase